MGGARSAICGGGTGSVLRHDSEIAATAAAALQANCPPNYAGPWAAPAALSGPLPAFVAEAAEAGAYGKAHGADSWDIAALTAQLAPELPDYTGAGGRSWLRCLSLSTAVALCFHWLCGQDSGSTLPFHCLVSAVSPPFPGLSRPFLHRLPDGESMVALFYAHTVAPAATGAYAPPRSMQVRRCLCLVFLRT